MKKLIILSIVFAFSTVGLAEAEEPGRHRHHPPRIELTEEQQSCLEGLLGPREEGKRPSHEAMHAALTECKVELPAPPPRERDQEEQQAAEGAR